MVDASSTSVAVVTVAIVTFESNENLRRALQSVVASLERKDVSLLIVDNSQSASAKIVFDEATLMNPNLEINYLMTPQNNMGLARKIAIEHSKTEWVAFIDSDCVVGKNWLTNLMAAFERVKNKNVKVCAVGGVNYAPPDQCDFYSALELMKKVIWGNLNSTQLTTTDCDKYVDHLSTTNVLYERRAVLDVGNFSESTQAVGEDLDLSYRLRIAGRCLIYTPDATVQHFESTSLTDWAKRAFRFGQAQANLVFNGGWSHVLNRRVLWPNVFLGLMIISLILATVNFNFIYLPAIYIFFVFLSSFLLCFLYSRTRLTLLLTKLFFVSHFSYALGQHWVVLKKLKSLLLRFNRHTKEANEFS